jgi:FixJ family two-component response regulator
MPGMSGLDLQEKLKAEGSRIPMIFITAHSDAKIKMQAMSAGAIEFLSKPFDDEVLLEKVRAALQG